MAYIEKKEREAQTANAATRLCSQPDFQFLCEAFISDLVDKQSEMLALDGTQLSRAQGAAVELKRLLDIIYGSEQVAAKIAYAIQANVQRERMLFAQEIPERQSYQA